MCSGRVPSSCSTSETRLATPYADATQGRSLLCYSTEAGGLGAARSPQWGTRAKPPISDFEQVRVYLGPALLQNSHNNMSQLYTIVHS
jgi:hypothetical protein